MTATQITLRTCVLCQSTFDSDLHNGKEDDKQNFKMLEKLCNCFSNPFSDERVDFEEMSAGVVCHECGPLVNSALVEKENVECVEKGVRKLQMELLQKTKYLLEAIHQYYEGMRTIDVMMEDVMVTSTTTLNNGRSKTNPSGLRSKEPNIFRNTVKQVLKDLRLCENALDIKTDVNPDIHLEVYRKAIANSDNKSIKQAEQNSANIDIDEQAGVVADHSESNHVSIERKSVTFKGNRPSTSSGEWQQDFNEEDKTIKTGKGHREQEEPTKEGGSSCAGVFRNAEKQVMKVLRLCDKCGDALDSNTNASSKTTLMGKQQVQNSSRNNAREVKKALDSESRNVTVEEKNIKSKGDPSPVCTSAGKRDHNADHEMDQISDGYSDRGEGASAGESESEDEDEPKCKPRPRKRMKIDKFIDTVQDPSIHYTGMSSFKKYYVSRAISRKKYILRHGRLSQGGPKTDNPESPLGKYYIDYNAHTDTLSLEDIVIHLEDKEEGNEYLQCSKCGYRLTPSNTRKKRKNDIRMIDHILGHHLQKYQCDKDGQMFSSNDSYMVHARAHFHADDDRFKCDICGRKMCSPESLPQHKFTHMNEEEKQQAIKSGFKYRTKKRYEGRPFQCSICGMSFNDPRCLKAHEIIHVDREQRSTICPVCGKSVLERTFRRSHSKRCRPTGEKLPPVQCPKCPNVYENIERMKAHLKKMHSENSNERPCICPTCGRAFKRNFDLKDHFKVHSDEKPFECGRGCGTSFKRKNACKKHEETCKGIKDNMFQ